MSPTWIDSFLYSVEKDKMNKAIPMITSDHFITSDDLHIAFKESVHKDINLWVLRRATKTTPSTQRVNFKTGVACVKAGGV